MSCSHYKKYIYTKTIKPIYLTGEGTKCMLHVLLAARMTNRMSRVMEKPTFCICKSKDADQLRGKREADLHLCFRLTGRTNPLLPKSEISSLLSASVAVQPRFCWTWTENRSLFFLILRLNYIGDNRMTSGKFLNNMNIAVLFYC